MKVTTTVKVGKTGAAFEGRQLAKQRHGSIPEAEDWVSRNRETWRGALDEGETHFVARMTDEQGLWVMAIEVDGAAWGDAGVTVIGMDEAKKERTGR